MSEQSSPHTGLTTQIPAVVWAIVIFVLSSIPSDKIPTFALSIPDKLVHAAIFSVFCFLCYRAFRHQSRILTLARFPLTSSVLLTMIYGCTDEMHQLFVPGRSADLFDVVADA